jgi:hypothetical protein
MFPIVLFHMRTNNLSSTLLFNYNSTDACGNSLWNQGPDAPD